MNELEEQSEEKWIINEKLLKPFDALEIGYDASHLIPYYGLHSDVEEVINENLVLLSCYEYDVSDLVPTPLCTFSGEKMLSNNTGDKLNDLMLIRVLYYIAEQIPEKYLVEEMKQVFELRFDEEDRYMYITQMLENGKVFRREYKYKELVGLSGRFIMIPGIKYTALFCEDECSY